MINKNKKCLVMLSGGLDSRLALKIMQEQGFETTALFFKLPFGTGCCNEGCSFNFSQMQRIKLNVIDCTKGELLQEYLNVIRKAEHGRGAGINPCIDCRIFMFKKAKEFADEQEISLIVSGEVLGERPMSQMKKALNLIEENSGLKSRLLRPLSAKLLLKTQAEKKGIVKRENLYSIEGRNRKRQIELAKKFNISYPSPAGGCLLCEKELVRRLKKLLERGANEEEIKLVNIGRHFLIKDCWVVLGRNEQENKIIECAKSGEKIIPDYIGPSAIILDAEPNKTPPAIPPKLLNKKQSDTEISIKPLPLGSRQLQSNCPEISVSETPNKPPTLVCGKKQRVSDTKLDELKDSVGLLIQAYSKSGGLKERGKFDKWRL